MKKWATAQEGHFRMNKVNWRKKNQALGETAFKGNQEFHGVLSYPSMLYTLSIIIIRMIERM